jgi:drug/metabolite transporter (DMT)-like permease
MSGDLSTRHATVLFVIVVLAWGTNWPVIKLIVESVSPLWTTAIRSWIALFIVIIILRAGNNLIPPPRDDMPVVLSISLLHMVAFQTLVAAGLQFIPAGEAIVLGYTTPLWVAMAAPFFLGERTSKGKMAGVVIGLLGLSVIFNHQLFEWSNTDLAYGCGLIMLAAVFWAASIIYVRSHTWIATPFQLLPRQLLVAGFALSITALVIEGWPIIDWTNRLALLLLYSSLVGTALAYWAMSMVNRSLPALTTSIGTTATHVVGIASAALALGERVDLSLILATVLIVGGIVVNALAGAKAKV